MKEETRPSLMLYSYYIAPSELHTRNEGPIGASGVY
jgi:hypothetical protein